MAYELSMCILKELEKTIKASVDEVKKIHGHKHRFPYYLMVEKILEEE